MQQKAQVSNGSTPCNVGHTRVAKKIPATFQPFLSKSLVTTKLLCFFHMIYPVSSSSDCYFFVLVIRGRGKLLHFSVS